jgi:hypothetical protein
MAKRTRRTGADIVIDYGDEVVIVPTGLEVSTPTVQPIGFLAEHTEPKPKRRKAPAKRSTRAARPDHPRAAKARPTRPRR